jgi:hypothetical protein
LPAESLAYGKSIGKLVFTKYRDRTIMAKKADITAEPNRASLDQRRHIKEAAAFSKFTQNDPELSVLYNPIDRIREVTDYTMTV